MRRIVATLVFGSLACRGVISTPAEFRRAVASDNWSLTELAGQPAPTGAGGRRATLVFDLDSSRVSGFAGCNRYTGGYTVEGENRLRFTPLAMTKMACTEGMDLERQLGDALTRTDHFQLTDSMLYLYAGSTPVATFVRPRKAGGT